MTWHAASDSPAQSAAIQVYLLGMVDFDSALWLQAAIASEVAEHRHRSGALLLCEHPSLITIGREGTPDELTCGIDDLRHMGLEPRWINRGGGCVVHGSSQLSIYPVLSLSQHDLGLDDYREAIETALLAVCREQRVPSWRLPERPGVFGRSGQMATVGAAVRRGMTQHGAFLNVAPRMELQRLVRPERLEYRPTSLAVERLRCLSMAAVRESVARHFASAFGFDRVHFYTGHPLLRRTRRLVAYA